MKRRFLTIAIIAVIACSLNTGILLLLVTQQDTNSNYTRIPSTNIVPPAITGSFIQFTSLSTFNYSWWSTELANAKTIGIDTIIIQWVHDGATNKTLYQSSTFAFETASVSPDLFPPQPDPHGFPAVPDALASLLLLASPLHIAVYVGLTITWDFADRMDNATWLAAELALNRRLATEVLHKYGTIDSFAGFYIPYEILQASSWQGEDGVRYGNFFGAVSACIRDVEQSVLGVQKLICTAPAASAVTWAPYSLAFWEVFLARAGIDVLMIQDGVGVHRNGITSDLPAIYHVIADACNARHVSFWTDLEIFDITEYSPALFSRVQAQLDLECKYVGKIIVFDIPHYMSLQYSPSAAVLYHAYDAYRSRF